MPDWRMVRERNDVSLFSRRRNRALFDPAHLNHSARVQTRFSQQSFRLCFVKILVNPKRIGCVLCRAESKILHPKILQPKRRGLQCNFRRRVRSDKWKKCPHGTPLGRVCTPCAMVNPRKAHIRSSCLTPGLICAKVNTDPHRPPGHRERMDAKRSY